MQTKDLMDKINFIGKRAKHTIRLSLNFYSSSGQKLNINLK
jgi:hypothetical protein